MATTVQNPDNRETLHLRETKASCTNDKAPYVIIALVVSGVAGAVIVILSGLNIFGSMRTIGFIASMAGGGSLICIAIGGGIWIAVTNLKNREPIVGSAVFPLGEEKGKYERRRQLFLDVVNERTKKTPIRTFDLSADQAPDFETNAKEAIIYLRRYGVPAGVPIQQFEDYWHFTVTTDKIPGILFRQARSGSDMTEHVRMAEKARTICEENGLDLLYVPKCKLVGFDASVVMEENVELLEGGRDSQKACYQWAVKDHQLQSHFKELFSQLTIFICLMKFAGVDYDKIRLMKDGRVALFGLDEKGAVKGLATEWVQEECYFGLFTMIPLEWFDEFIEIAKRHLPAEDFIEFQKHLSNLEKEARKRSERTLEIGEFYQSRDITVPTQPLIFDKQLFNEKSPEVVLFAEKLIEHLNQQIATLPQLSMVEGREITIQSHGNYDFFKEIVKESPESQAYWHQQFASIANAGLEALQEQGYIFSYEVGPVYNYLTIVC